MTPPSETRTKRRPTAAASARANAVLPMPAGPARHSTVGSPAWRAVR